MNHSHRHYYKPEATVPTLSIGDVFRVDGKKMFVVGIDDPVIWFRDECGTHYERQVEQIEQYGKYVQPVATDLLGYPIDTMPYDGQYYLVSYDPAAHNPGGQPYVLAKRDGSVITPMFSSGQYCGARLWHPFRLVTD